MNRIYEQTKGKEKKKPPIKNITINIPNCYDKNIQWLIKHKIVASRSDAIRQALDEFLRIEFETNLELLGFEGTNGQANSLTSLKQNLT